MSWQLAHHPPGHFGESDAVRWALRAAALAVLVGALLYLHGLFHDVSKGPSLQRIRLLNPSAAEVPPPPPPEQQPEPDKKVQEEISAVDQQFAAPGAKGEAGSLGVDSEGDPGNDAFGLAAKPGGRDLTTYPEGSGYGLGVGAGGGGGPGVDINKLNAMFGKEYERRLGSKLAALLTRREDLRHQGYRATAAIWLDGDGRISKAEVLDLAAEPALTSKLNAALIGLATGEAPPKGYRFPIRIRVSSKMDSLP